MDRHWAIGKLVFGVSRYIEEFCIGDKEKRQAYAKAREALHTVGVTDAEMDYDSDTGSF